MDLQLGSPQQSPWELAREERIPAFGHCSSLCPLLPSTTSLASCLENISVALSHCEFFSAYFLCSSAAAFLVIDAPPLTVSISSFQQHCYLYQLPLVIAKPVISVSRRVYIWIIEKWRQILFKSLISLSILKLEFSAVRKWDEMAIWRNTGFLLLAASLWKL